MRGFTLVELVAVMMVLGILSIGTVRFLNDSSAGYGSTVARAALAQDARFAMERMARELRDALPNSVRVSTTCVEFVPVVGASSYRTLPVATPSSTFQSVPVDPLPSVASFRAAVYPDVGLYDLTSPAAISPPVSLSAPDANNEVIVTMASAHRFVVESPANRYFLISDPVSFCVDAGRLWRYTGYGFQAVQPTPAVLPGALPGRALMAEEVLAATPFSLNDATLTRNAVVAMDVTFNRDDDSVRIEHTAQVRNVP